MLPKGLAAEIRIGSWPVLPIFEFLRAIGNVPEDDYRRTFNLGVGMILAVGERQARKAEQILEDLNEPHFRIGRVIRKPRTEAGRVVYR